MRAGLLEIEQIEAYLMGSFNEHEQNLFERKLKEDASFQEKVNLQEDLMHGLNYLAIQEDIAKAEQKSAQIQQTKTWGLILGVLVLLAVFGLFISKQNEKQEFKKIEQVIPSDTVKNVEDSNLLYQEESSLEIKEQETESLIKEATVHKNVKESLSIPIKNSQWYSINQNRDTVLRGAEGSLIKIPAKSFATTDSILRISLTEYYQAADIAFANLSTISKSGQILETGGMLYLEAFDLKQNTIELQKGKKIELGFPRNGDKIDMHLFYGKQNEEKNQEWELASEPIVSDEVDSTMREELVFTIVEEMPIFPGCETEASRSKKNVCSQTKMQAYLQKNIMIPIELANRNYLGTIYVSYIIDQKGFVNNVRAVRGTNKRLKEEAVRVVQSLPRMQAGKQRGIAVPVQYTIPIRFNLMLEGEANRTFSEEEITIRNDSIQALRRKEKEAVLNQTLDNLKVSKKESVDFISEVDYYVLSSSQLGYINCDAFYKDQRQKVEYALSDLPALARARLIFQKNRVCIANTEKSFGEVPIGEKASILAYQVKKGQLYIAFQEVHISDEVPPLNFQRASFADLKQYQAQLNAIWD